MYPNTDVSDQTSAKKQKRKEKIQMYPNGGYKEQYYSVMEETEYIMKDDYHCNKGSSMQMMKPDHQQFNHNKHNQINGYDHLDKNHGHEGYGGYGHQNKQHGHEGYGSYGHVNNKHGHEGYGSYDHVNNKHGHEGYGSYDHVNNKHGHEGYGSYDRVNNKHGHEGYGSYDHVNNKHGHDGYGAYDHQNIKHGHDDGKMKNKYSGYGGNQNGGYWANQGPRVPMGEHQSYYYSEKAKRPVWDCKGIDD